MAWTSFPRRCPSRRHAVGGLTREQRLRRTTEDFLRGRGLSEAITYSFISPDWIARLRLPDQDRRRRVLHIANPLSEEQSAMRTTLLCGLLDAARYNLDRDVEELRLFECGRVFLSNGQERLPDEQLHLGVVLAGAYEPATWRSPARPRRLLCCKGPAGRVCSMRSAWTGGSPTAGLRFYIPGAPRRSSSPGARRAGSARCIRSSRARSASRSRRQRSRSTSTSRWRPRSPSPKYQDLISYPAVRQDIAVVVDDAIEARTVVDVVRAAGGPELRSVEVFDLYRGEQLPEGKKSLALRLAFQAADRTLTDDEVASQREQIRDALDREVGGSLRE